jgi:predicted transcriptional regulator
MKREDVGPVPVVSDHAEKRVVGIVTDRDLAINVVAEGRDPHQTRVDEVMTPNPVTCREDADISEAVRTMADHQVRRIPIVDSNNRLCGIVAQADVARHAEEEQVGEMVEEISQPYGMGSWPEGRYAARAARSMSSLAVGALCLGIGAGLMFMFDPRAGRGRRTVLRDKTTSLVNTSSEAVGRRARDLKNRASGLYSDTRSRVTGRSETQSGTPEGDRTSSFEL